MSEVGAVLSDVHVECQSHTVKDHEVTRFNVRIPVIGDKLCCYSNCMAGKKSHSYVEESHQSADTCSSNTLSDVSLQYDSDGDLVLDRHPHKHHVSDSPPVRKKSKVDHCDMVQLISDSEIQDDLEICNQRKTKYDTDKIEIQDKKSDVASVEIVTSLFDYDDQNEIENSQERDSYSKIEKFAHECRVQNNSDKKCLDCFTDKCTCNSSIEGSSSSYNDSDDLKDIKQCSCCKEEYFITIKHSLATRLQDVGQQIWHGSLLLSDYIIHHPDSFNGKVIVDLGAGVGLTSIVAAMYAKTVYSTDVGDDVLTLNKDNVVTARTYPTLPVQHSLCEILVKELDWFHGPKVNEASKYGLSSQDIINIYNSDILLAADVIYDFDITDAFFNTIKQIMSHPPEKTLYISLEKRMVFTVEYLAVTSPGYNYFCELLDKLENDTNDCKVQFKITKCDLNFQQYFQYNKTKYLELWCVSSKIIAT